MAEYQWPNGCMCLVEPSRTIVLYNNGGGWNFFVIMGVTEKGCVDLKGRMSKKCRISVFSKVYNCALNFRIFDIVS